MAIRTVSKAIAAAQEIAVNDSVPAERKEQLVKQVLDAGAAATAQPVWDNWAQRLVAGSLGAIGLVLALFTGVAVLRQVPIEAAVTSALTGAIGALAGMFAQRITGGGPQAPAGAGDPTPGGAGVKDGPVAGAPGDSLPAGSEMVLAEERELTEA
ncbi:MAG: hypothetical protein EKK62_13080 [Acidimicrobiia bacterium]|nr:MAG: hypothetical protein EKK62_13080 [Acidimicrobiia bacterium]